MKPAFSYNHSSSFLSTETNTMHSIEEKENKLVLSSLSRYYKPVNATGFSVKYVLDGTEVYTLGEEQYVVGPGSYLLSNRYKDGQVEIESNQPVKGICITLSPDLITSVVASMRRPDTSFPDEELGQFFNSDLFPDDQYHAQETHLGGALHALSQKLDNNRLEPDGLGIEFFYSLAEHIIRDQMPVFKQLQAIPSVKTATKKELLKKIRKGKAFIDASFTAAIDVEMVAKQACLSEYHFFRLFKKSTGITPHQYILQKRLEKAKQLLQQQVPVSDTALHCGFADVFSFSKSFKKQFGFSPSRFMEK